MKILIEYVCIKNINLYFVSVCVHVFLSDFGNRIG